MIEKKRTTVKEESLLKRLLSGEPLMIGEYRGTSTEEIKYVDKVSGKPEVFAKVSHTIEVTQGNGSLETVVCEERQPKGIDINAGYVSGVKKGQRVALRLDGLQRVKGRLSASVTSDDDAIVVLS